MVHLAATVPMLACAVLLSWVGCAGSETARSEGSAEVGAQETQETQETQEAREAQVVEESTDETAVVQETADDTLAAEESPEADPPESGGPADLDGEAEPEPEANPESAPSEITAAELFALPGSASLSTGDPNHGALQTGVPLPAFAPGLRSNPIRPNRDAYYGTVEMTQALVRAAAAVEEALPGAEMTISDMSRREGGPLPHHGSHQAGRDVDLLFYYLDRHGEPMRSKGVPVDPDGRGWDFADLSDPRDDVRMRIDIPRTWRFLQALVEDDDTHVQRIFVVEHVREMLLAHARRVRAPGRAIQRIDQMTCQPSHPHDDHLHIRFFCTAEDIRDGGCEDTYPMYGWHRRTIRQAGEEPVIARRQRRPRNTPAVATPRPAMARTVSRDEARRRAGPMHRRVREWLDRREEWADKPHPGRPWCP